LEGKGKENADRQTNGGDEAADSVCGEGGVYANGKTCSGKV